MRKLILPLCIVFIIVLEFLPTYLIMPFPGSQELSLTNLAYFLYYNKWITRGILLLVLLWQLILLLRAKKYAKLVVAIFFLLIYCAEAYVVSTRMQAQKIFITLDKPEFGTAASSRVAAGKLVIAVVLRNEAKAYPIEIIGYHHQVRDTVGGQPVIVTYCTVCRTGRIYSPVIDGQTETFSLVGMQHYDAFFADATTHSWWMQATGEAVAGKRKGNHINEIYSEQMTLQSWLRKYPNSKILQPDDQFLERYKWLAGYDEGRGTDELEQRDLESWQLKSWVVGVGIDGIERSYDWNQLESQRVINDTLAGKQILLAVESDSVSLHGWEWNGAPCTFEIDSTGNFISARQFAFVFDMDGNYVGGDSTYLENLQPLKVSQEFLHAWEQFHPASTRHKSD